MPPKSPNDKPAGSESDYLTQLTNAVLQKKSLYVPSRPPGERQPTSVGDMTPRPVKARGASIAGGGDGAFSAGTILLFEDDTIGVYKGAQKEKDYDVVYMLDPTGLAEAQGVHLADYDLKNIGQLPAEFLMRLSRTSRWERDAIIYHLSHFDHCARVPEIKPGHPSSAAIPKPPPAPAAALEKGRRISISFGGPREWHAVFWGDDELGTMVVHDTNGKWSLMHLDLKRFSDSLVLGEMISADVRAAILKDITG